MDETIDGDATLEMEREWESMERDAMECHDSVRSLRHENAMLEIAFMAKEDQLSQEYQESKYYEQFDQEYEATWHPETTTADTPVGPTSPSDAAPAEVPDEAASSTRPRSPPSTTGTAPWDAYWDHFPRPFGDAPWHQPEPAAASSSASLGATPKPKATPAPSVPRVPSVQRQTGWRAKMAYFMVLYENQYWNHLHALVQDQSPNLQQPIANATSWKGKASRWFQLWQSQDWGGIEQLHQWYLGFHSVFVFTKVWSPQSLIKTMG